jgi:hypothetical protein
VRTYIVGGAAFLLLAVGFAPPSARGDVLVARSGQTAAAARADEARRETARYLRAQIAALATVEAQQAMHSSPDAVVPGARLVFAREHAFSSSLARGFTRFAWQMRRSRGAAGAVRAAAEYELRLKGALVDRLTRLLNGDVAGARRPLPRLPRGLRSSAARASQVPAPPVQPQCVELQGQQICAPVLPAEPGDSHVPQNVDEAADAPTQFDLHGEDPPPPPPTPDPTGSSASCALTPLGCGRLVPFILYAQRVGNMCTTSMAVRAFYVEGKDRTAILWRAKETCPLALHKGKTALWTYSPRNFITSGTAYDQFANPGDVPFSRGDHSFPGTKFFVYNVHYNTTKVAPGGQVWRRGTNDTYGVTFKACAGYGTNTLICNFERVFHTTLSP